MTILVLEVEVVEVEIAKKEEKKGGKYWAEALVKLVTLEGENNTQAMLGYIKSGLKLNTH